MPVTPTGCEEPQSGCGYDYYWDSSQCYCAYSGYTCSAPTSGCGEDYYWDYDQCYCRSYDGSSEPIGGYDDSTTIVDEYSSENLIIADEFEYAIVDDKKMVRDKLTLRGVQPLNRILIDLKELEKNA